MYSSDTRVTSPSSRRLASTSSRLLMTPSTTRFSISSLSPARSATSPACLDGKLVSCALWPSPGSAHPWAKFHLSLKASNRAVLAAPGGRMFRDLPLVSSMRGVKKCSSTRSPSVCVCLTQSMSYWSLSKPAKATRSKSSMTARCCSSVGASSMWKLITPLVYFQAWGVASISRQVCMGSPASTSGAGSRQYISPVGSRNSLKSRTS